MSRKTFDQLMSSMGIFIAITLVGAGVLASWGANFAKDSVRNQLVAQNIMFPAAGSPALADPAIGKYLNKYAGKQLTNGEQAKAYAEHFIGTHLKAIGGGKTYAELSAQAQANPTDAALAGTVSTMFRGETLRGLLLNAYAFWKIGEIATIAGIAAFLAALAMLGLVGLGIWHARRTPVTEEIFEPMSTTGRSAYAVSE